MKQKIKKFMENVIILMDMDIIILVRDQILLFEISDIILENSNFNNSSRYTMEQKLI